MEIRVSASKLIVITAFQKGYDPNFTPSKLLERGYMNSPKLLAFTLNTNSLSPILLSWSSFLLGYNSHYCNKSCNLLIVLTVGPSVCGPHLSGFAFLISIILILIVKY